jgi:hypothetical protein
MENGPDDESRSDRREYDGGSERQKRHAEAGPAKLTDNARRFTFVSNEAEESAARDRHDEEVQLVAVRVAQVSAAGVQRETRGRSPLRFRDHVSIGGDEVGVVDPHSRFDVIRNQTKLAGAAILHGVVARDGHRSRDA